MPSDKAPQTRLVDAAKKAANLGIALRDFHREFPETMSEEDLLDFAASVVLDGFGAPAHVNEIDVRFGVLCVNADEASSLMMPKPETVQ